MAFEPLETDEKIERASAKPTDMDTQMLFGCSGFLIASLGGYGLSVWPFFVFQTTDQLGTMAWSLGLGLIPTIGLTAYMARRFGLAGTCGAIGGALASAMFLYLRIQQAFLAYLARQAPEPQYPASMEIYVPLAFILAVTLVGVALLQRDPDEDSNRPSG